MSNSQMRISVLFVSNECEADNHESCAEIYTGLNIEATCSCNCHKIKEGLGPRQKEPSTTNGSKVIIDQEVIDYDT